MLIYQYVVKLNKGVNFMVNTRKSLYRLPKQGQIAGVCAGLADYFDFDVTLMRVIWVVAAFATGGAVIFLYLILAIIVPTSDEEVVFKSKGAKAAENGETFGEKVQNIGKDLQSNSGANRLRNVMGIFLLVLGIWLLLVQFFPQWLTFRWDFVWPVLLIVAGLLIVIKRK